MYSSPYIPTIDPVILEIIGPLAIRWYSLAYIAGVIFSWWISKKLIKLYPARITEQDIEDFVPITIISIVLGGRLGHVLIYDPIYYLSNPLEILKTYEGGMSFHGAVIAMAISTAIFCYKRGIHFLEITDVISTTASFGIFLGRIANFINGELFGKVTSHPIGVIFFAAEPAGVPRHPSQLYEALFEGALLLVITMYLAFRKEKIKDLGFITGIWSVLYSIFRFVIEFYREPDGIVDCMVFEISTGQFLSIIMGLAGLLILTCRRKFAKNYYLTNGHRSKTA
ncbi:MAG: prolipoprotein diacylglyceryl transferase [Rickettsiaceae bacterium]|jgi:phosphatidylglycerol:prolipoprotein diacylglycerol transferase|nr:prolipoprotein diacylglyceryl transferase [Rickettsiaceae bacterium]